MFRRHRLESMNVNFAELSIPQQPKFATAGIITFKRTFCSLSTNQESGQPLEVISRTTIFRWKWSKNSRQMVLIR
jgi:hypothetical protein